MQENKQDKQRTHELHHEDKQMEEVIVTTSPIGNLITDQLMFHIPADEQTSEESAQRQQDVRCGPVEEVEDRHSEHLRPVPVTQRQ